MKTGHFFSKNNSCRWKHLYIRLCTHIYIHTYMILFCVLEADSSSQSFSINGMNNPLPLQSSNIAHCSPPTTPSVLFSLQFWNVILSSELMLFSCSAGFLTPEILICGSFWQANNWHQLTSFWLAKWYMKRKLYYSLAPGSSIQEISTQKGAPSCPLVLLMRYIILWSHPGTLSPSACA